MGNNVVVIGTQWGDEGKGKVVDLLTEDVAAVVRFQGGHNAGHTLVVDGQQVALHLVPSGVLHPGVECLVGNGVVVAPDALVDEINRLESGGLAVRERLRVSPACPLILPSHVALDKARERARGGEAIGTTGRGIGPAYEDKVARRALKAWDLLDADRLRDKVAPLLDYHNFLLERYYSAAPVRQNEVLDTLMRAAGELKPVIADVADRLRQLSEAGRKTLFEGAQGALLDVDFGTYPYVTSSNTTAGAAATGSGVGPLGLDYVLGITKAYNTRVGGGPFPTELFDEVGQRLAQEGNEFGTTTGRPRRCGWLDAVALRSAAHVNSLSGLCITKLDVLDGFDELKICVAYDYNGRRVDTAPPVGAEACAACTPIYETLPGWGDATVRVSRWENLPPSAQQYLEWIETFTGIPVDIVSTGPDRKDTIIRRDPFA